VRFGAAALAALLAGCQTISGAYDRMFGSRPAKKPAELVAFTPKASARVLWQARAGAAEKSVFFPAVDGDTVYVASAAGSVSGFHLRTGAQVVRIETGERLSGGVAAAGGLVVVGSAKGELLAFDRDGKRLWRAALGGEILAPAAVRDGVVAVRAGGGQLYGLEAADGKRRWIYQRTAPSLSLRAHAGPVSHRGAVFAGFPGGRLVAIALANGAVGWEGVVAQPRGATELERVADVVGFPVVDERQVCAVAFQGRAACFEPSRGTLLWARELSSVAGLAMDSRYVYVADEKDAVLALDRSSGASIWRQDRLAGRRLSAPLALGRFVVVGDFEGYVHALSREDGSFAARLATDGSAIVAPPVALDATSFLVQTASGGVFAIAVE
jgi:outer membrane protein assembly factor BamB